MQFDFNVFTPVLIHILLVIDRERTDTVDKLSKRVELNERVWNDLKTTIPLIEESGLIFNYTLEFPALKGRPKNSLLKQNILRAALIDEIKNNISQPRNNEDLERLRCQRGDPSGIRIKKLTDKNAVGYYRQAFDEAPSNIRENLELIEKYVHLLPNDTSESRILESIKSGRTKIKKSGFVLQKNG